ncbi:MAG TPA: Nif11-like leader peptide family RiPP precursor [Bacillota bacterium]|nr:Nif11-like leader peptide family RiPP precursor [Peptococcaceae bacterium MAG4]NLW39168.1 Nif11-like leader peptide family natural product precursor [Peptococcaceae bacterium]HUM59485.1 Nif11-like leader peptide family RiPP precursor [Bacillota bacterium]
MSIEELNRFLQMVATNEELAEKMKEIGENDDAIVAYGKELGYDFDRQDIEELRKKVIDLHKVRIKKNLEKAVAAADKEQRPGMRNLHRFVQLVGENKEIAEKVQEISFDDPKAIIAYARDLGFEFDEKDLEEFGGNMLERSDELSEEELEMVAGGFVDLMALVAFLSIAAAGAAAVGVTLGIIAAAKGL